MKKLTILTVLFLTTVVFTFAKGNTAPPMMEKHTEMETKDEMGMEMEMMNSPIIDYKDMDQVMMLAKSKPTVLFFKANWCPSCLEASKIFENDKEQLNGVNLVVVNYDNSADIKTKYGVTYQHTFVQVDTEGSALATWSGGATPELLMNIVKGEM